MSEILKLQITLRIICNLLSLSVPDGRDNTNVLFQFIYTGNSNRFFLFFSYFLCVPFDTLSDIFIPFNCYCTQSVPKRIINLILNCVQQNFLLNPSTLHLDIILQIIDNALVPGRIVFFIANINISQHFVFRKHI